MLGCDVGTDTDRLSLCLLGKAFMIILKEDLPALKEASILDQYLLVILLYEFALGLVLVFVDPLEYWHEDAVHSWLR